jgi:epoxyqueuosine reductase
MTDAPLLDDAGLNLRAVFALDDLPPALGERLRAEHDPQGRFRQLILLGHAGRRLWQAVQAAAPAGEHPIDDFTVRTASAWLDALPGRPAYTIVYPGPSLPPLQALGELAGWHHATPFMVGILPGWGSWFAYRAVILAATDLPPTPRLKVDSPCLSCAPQACRAACPGSAMAGPRFALDACVAYRTQTASACQDRCLARLACPVGAEHRYLPEQQAHSYLRSLAWLREFAPPAAPGLRRADPDPGTGNAPGRV